jgi:autotransporter-associated beta strand protein
MQLSELVFYCGSANVTRPYRSVGYIDTLSAGGSPFGNGETPEKAFDGNAGTKWFDQRGGQSRPQADRDNLWVSVTYDSPKTITSYAWYTANDRANRDPAAWRLQGSNDGGTTWTDLDVKTGFSATRTRKALAGEFSLSGSAGSLGANYHVVVEQGATLRISGGVVPAKAIENNGGTVELTDGATLSCNDGVLDGAVSGVGGVEVTGGDVTIFGSPTYAGATHVSGGTLNIGAAANPLPRAFDGKYFRLTVKRSNGGTGDAFTDNVVQASEFKLFDAAGTMQNKNLAVKAVGTPVGSLTAGSFTCARDCNGNASKEQIQLLFDDNTSTKWLSGGGCDGSPANYMEITMRLADNANPVASYNFYSANDHMRRSPSDWTLEGSRDGATWELLDERRWAPHVGYTSSGSYSVNPYKPFNNGVNYRFETEAPPAFKGKFLRFTFKNTPGSNASLQISELMVFNTLGENIAKGLAEAANNTAAASLAPGQFTCPENYYNSGKTEGPKFLFDDKVSTKICNGALNGATANYRCFTIRFRDDDLPLSGYLFTTANDRLERSPCDWMVEGSEDGVMWTTLDERAGVAQPYCLYTAMNAGRPFTFASLATASGLAALPADSEVTVDAGATLNLNDANATVSRLKVDCTLGGGTINPFRPASGGTLALVNVPAELTSLKDYEVPITLASVQEAANLRAWTVTVNGAKSGFKATYRNGKIVLEGGCCIIFIR